jgi:hypothetical protein
VLTPDDRIDDALKSLARVEASREFAGQVRTRIEGAATGPARWPRAVWAGALVVLVAVVGAWLLQTPVVTPSSEVARARPAVPVVSDLRPPAVVAEPAPRAPGTRGVRPVPKRVAETPHRLRATPDPATSDHERALAPLAAIDELDAKPIAPGALVMADQVIAPLTPIAPLVTSGGATELEGGGR